MKAHGEKKIKFLDYSYKYGESRLRVKVDAMRVRKIVNKE